MGYMHLPEKAFLQESQSELAQLYRAVGAAKPVPFSELERECTALVIVDMINGFVKQGPLSSENALEIQPGIAALLERCNMEKVPSVFFMDSHTMESPEFSSYPVHCLKGTIESSPTEELEKVGGYTVIPKNSTNGFLEPAFQSWLKKNKTVTTFIVVGCCTDICVQQFALTLKTDFNRRNLASRVIVPMNLSSTYDAPGHGANLVNLVSFHNMQTNGIEVTPQIEF